MTIAEQTLQGQLDAQKAGAQTQLPADIFAVLMNDPEGLAAAGAADKALHAGQTAPTFTLPDATGTPFALADALAHGPVVLVFYRGSWCPYCNTTLHAYQQHLSQFTALGATLVAVSPQTPDNSLTIIEKQELTFPVLSDADNTVARQYGLVYKVSDIKRETLTNLGIDLSRYNGNAAWELPMTGTFIIAPDGTIRRAAITTDFTQRLDPAAIIADLTALAAPAR